MNPSLCGDYLDTFLTASLSPEARLQWIKTQLTQLDKSLGRIPCPHASFNASKYKVALKDHPHRLPYGPNLSPSAIWEVVSVVEKISRKLWDLPDSYRKVGLHALIENLGLNILSTWEGYYGAAIRS